MTRRVLVTAVGGNIGQGVVKALRAGRRDYFIADTPDGATAWIYRDHPLAD